MSGLEFLAPAGLLALLGVPLVVLFHMRNTTPVVQEVPSLRFWRLAMREESHRERFKRPPVSLLFLLHLLLVGLLAFALARPATSRALGGFGRQIEPVHMILLLDGSTSMSAIDTTTGGTRFATAKALAAATVAGLDQGDVATVILMATRIATFEATDSAGLESLKDRLESLELPGGRADLNAALKLSKDLLLPSMADRIVVISDGALAADPSIIAGINARIDLLIAGSGSTGNVAITDIATKSSIVTPGQQQLYARIVNFGSAAVTAPVVISVDGIEIARADVTIEAGGAAEDLIQDLPPGAGSVTVRYDVFDALPADNSASSVLIQGADFGLRILLVTDFPTALLRALSVLPGAHITMVSPLEAASDAGAYDLIVYEHATPPVGSPATPVLFVNPLETGPLPARGGVMANPAIQRIRAQDPLLMGVELSGVTFGQTPVFDIDASATEIVGAEDGPLIYRGSAPGSGQPMIVFAFDITQSNLPQRVAFPILIANVAAELAPSPLPSASPLGDPILYRPRAGAATVQVTSPGGTVSDIDTGIASAPDGLREIAFAGTGEAGEYQIVELGENGEPLGGGRFVVNAGHPAESDLTANAGLAPVLASAKASGDAGAGKAVSDLWPVLVAAGLIVILLEWLLLLNPFAHRRRFSPSGRFGGGDRHD